MKKIILIRDITECRGYKFSKGEIFEPVKVLDVFVDIKAADGRETELLAEGRDFEWLED